MNKEQVLYEDKDIIVCYKPAGIATQTARIGQPDMVSEVTNYLGTRALLVHRLDQPVEGILVFGKNQKAAAELSRQITENRMEKYYYAVVSDFGQTLKAGSNVKAVSEAGNACKVTACKVMLTDYLLKDGRTNISRIVPMDCAGAKKAVLEYEVLERKEIPIALIRVRLMTGRHHQIRLQMSHAGMSLLGDYKYADEETKGLSEKLQLNQIALCAYRLDFAHPATGRNLSFQKAPKGRIFQNFSM